ncbi:unnamed protein product [Rotaria sp. Silwood1]|nr:unnamed protein product [Rotaria sp. Silwood1]
MKKIELEEKYQEAIKCKFAIEKDFRNDIEDPVCRQILSSNIIEQLPLSSLSSSNEIINNNNEENQELIRNLSSNIRQWQEKTHALFQQQKEKGGIIDLDKNQDIIII